MPKIISEIDGSHCDYYVQWDNSSKDYLGRTYPGDRSVGGVRINASDELQAVLDAELRFAQLAWALAAKNRPVYSDED